MEKAKVAVFIGSASDEATVAPCADILKKLGIPFRFTVTSAHRTPERTAELVDSLEAAIAHINRYGSHHTDCIVTRDDAAAKAFLTRVDSAGVYRNVSTRFADGFVYGFGAEVGIATGKLHARGPMGLDGLTTYKYKLLGDGQLMAEMKSGQRAYTHLVLHEDCPL